MLDNSRAQRDEVCRVTSARSAADGFAFSGCLIIAASILDHVFLEPPAVLRPAIPVELPVCVQALTGGIGHREGVVRIVVHEQALPAEGDQTIDA
jgi:hypothetical protein